MGDEAREFEIKIKVSGGAAAAGFREAASGANELAGHTGKLTEVTKEGAHAAEKMEIGHKAMRFGLRQLGGEMAEVGHIAHLGFEGPMTAAFLAVTVVAGHFIKKMEEAKEASKKAAEEMAEAWTSGNEAMLKFMETAAESTAKFKELFEELTKSQHTSQAETDRAIAQLERMKQLQEEILKGREKEELAAAQTPEEKASIEQRYLDLNRGNDEAGRKRKTMAQQRELDLLEAGKPESDRKLAGAEEEALGKPGRERNEEIHNREEELKRLAKQLSEAKDDLKRHQIENTMYQVGGIKSGLEEEQRGAMSRLERARAEAARDEKRREQLRIEIGEGGRDLGDRQEANRTIRAGERRTELRGMGMDPSGRLPNFLLENIAGEEAVGRGGRMDHGQQSGVQELTNSLRLAGNSNEKITSILKDMQDLHLTHAQKLDELYAALKQVKQQVNSRNLNAGG